MCCLVRAMHASETTGLPPDLPLYKWFAHLFLCENVAERGLCSSFKRTTCSIPFKIFFFLRNNLVINQQRPRNRSILEKVPVPRTAKKFSACCGTGRFLTSQAACSLHNTFQRSIFASHFLSPLWMLHVRPTRHILLYLLSPYHYSSFVIPFPSCKKKGKDIPVTRRGGP
jgi:hypothetical protein